MTSYSQAAQLLINAGLEDRTLVILSRGHGPSPVVNLEKLDNPAAQLMAIAQAFDAEVN